MNMKIRKYFHTKKEIKGWKMCTKALKKYLNDPLYKNSFFVMLTSISNAGFGFIFWMLAAKLYPKEDVGIATALISSMALLCCFVWNNIRMIGFYSSMKRKEDLR